MTEDTKILLGESYIPTYWFNVQADLTWQLDPPLHPGTKQAAGPEDFAPLFPMSLIGQEMSQEREIEIPDEVRDIYRMWRPTPLYRARRLEEALGTPAHLYYKLRGDESGRQPQAEYCRRAGLLQQAGRHEADNDGNRRWDSGAVRWPLRATPWASIARSTWSRSATCRSRIASL